MDIFEAAFVRITAKRINYRVRTPIPALEDHIRAQRSRRAILKPEDEMSLFYSAEEKYLCSILELGLEFLRFSDLPCCLHQVLLLDIFTIIPNSEHPGLCHHIP